MPLVADFNRHTAANLPLALGRRSLHSAVNHYHCPERYKISCFTLLSDQPC